MALCDRRAAGIGARPTCPMVGSAPMPNVVPSVPTTPASQPAPKTATPMTPGAMTGMLVLKNKARVSSSAPSANRYTVAATGFGGTGHPVDDRELARADDARVAGKQGCQPEPFAEQHLAAPDGAGHHGQEHARLD